MIWCRRQQPYTGAGIRCQREGLRPTIVQNVAVEGKRGNNALQWSLVVLFNGNTWLVGRCCEVEVAEARRQQIASQ